MSGTQQDSAKAILSPKPDSPVPSAERPREQFSPRTEERNVKQILEGLSSRVPFYYYLTEMRVRNNVLDSPNNSDEVFQVVKEAANNWSKMSDLEKRPYRIYAMRQKQKARGMAEEKKPENATEEVAEKPREGESEEATERANSSVHETDTS